MIDNRPDKSGFAGHAVLFPLVEEYRDCAGVRRVFKIESEQTDLGWMLTATEQNDRPHGYSFKEFSTASPAEALGPLRHKIKAGLAIKYLDLSSKKPRDGTRRGARGRHVRVDEGARGAAEFLRGVGVRDVAVRVTRVPLLSLPCMGGESTHCQRPRTVGWG